MWQLCIFVNTVSKTEIKQEEGWAYAKKEAIRWDSSETADTAMWWVGKNLQKVKRYCQEHDHIVYGGNL